MQTQEKESGRLRIPQAAWPLVCPGLIDMLKAFALVAGHADGLPARRDRTVGRPDAVLLLIIHDDSEFRFGIINTHGFLAVDRIEKKIERKARRSR
ncbi:MAG: hypothetical protein ACJAUE_000786 [Alcanivorax sp.]|jgi:hypothetical protein